MREPVNVFDAMARHGHEQLIFCHDKGSGLKGIIGIHDTTLGPALGGCRMWKYSREEEAVLDVLRLSRGMTYKSAASGCNYGGGKVVIWADPRTEKSEELFRSLGRFVEGLQGRFITGTDVGTTYNDFVLASQETGYVVALPEEFGGSGDSSLITAFGVWKGIKACAQEVFSTDDLRGRTVAVQGLGKVGHYLIKYLHDEGAILYGTDIVEENIRKATASVPVKIVAPDDIYAVPCDFFSPNALGAIINDDTIGRLNCRAVAGAANNQLAEPRHGDLLQERGVLYAPDYVINAGGLIQVADELQGFNRERAFRKAAAIYDLLLKIFAIARDEGIPTYRAADRLAEQRIGKVGNLHKTYIGG